MDGRDRPGHDGEKSRADRADLAFARARAVKRFLKVFFWVQVCYFPIGMGGMLVSFFWWLAAKHFGSVHPNPYMGQVYPFDRTPRGGPQLIVYVTYAYHWTYQIGFWAFLGLLAFGFTSLLFGIIYKVRSTKSPPNSC